MNSPALRRERRPVSLRLSQERTDPYFLRFPQLGTDVILKVDLSKCHAIVYDE